MGKVEFWLFIGLLLIAALSLPAFRDVQMLQNLALSICTGSGLF
jgi:hypothetical protein